MPPTHCTKIFWKFTLEFEICRKKTRPLGTIPQAAKGQQTTICKNQQLKYCLINYPIIHTPLANWVKSWESCPINDTTNWIITGGDSWGCKLYKNILTIYSGKGNSRFILACIIILKFLGYNTSHLFQKMEIFLQYILEKNLFLYFSLECQSSPAV